MARIIPYKEPFFTLHGLDVEFFIHMLIIFLEFLEMPLFWNALKQCWVAIGPFRDPVWEQTREFQWMSDPQGPFIREFGSNARDEFVVFRLKE